MRLNQHQFMVRKHMEQTIKNINNITTWDKWKKELLFTKEQIDHALEFCK